MKKLAVIFAGIMIFAAASCAWCDVQIGPGYFEDETFGVYLYNFDKDGDGVLSDSEIASITGLNLSGMGITAIDGLHYLTNLQSLDCSNNKLVTLDLSQNTKLSALSCDSQVRNGLIVSLSGNTSYPYQVDFSEYISPDKFANVSNVQGLNSSGSSILTIYANGVAMFAARPGSVTYSYNTGHNSRNMSVTLSTAVEIHPNNFPDEVFGPYLLQFDTNGDGVLSPAEIESVTGIHLNETGVKSLEGIRHFWNLRQLNCRSSSITGALDLHGFEYLEEINCRSNTITSLDVSGCTALKNLYARSNNLYELNITDCNALEILNCGTNPDDTAEHTNHITALDLRGKTHIKELNCKRNALTSLDLTDCTDLEDLSCNNNQLASLDLTDCTALISLDCGRNQLSSLNVSGNTALKYLVCGSNDIGTLDVTNNTALTHLDAWDCHLSEIDLSNNTELDYLELGGENRNVNTHNRLTTIDLSNNTKLTYLAVDRNQITSLDVSGLPLLEKLMFQHNKKITSIDVSHNPALKELYCHNCSLADLDLSANPALTLLRCYSNDIRTLDLSNTPLISDLNTGSTSGVMAEIPALRLKYSPDISMPYRTEMKDYIGDKYTSITGVNAYDSTGGEILSSYMTDGTASFVNIPMKVVYAYDTGYTGSADISSDVRVALIPASSDFITMEPIREVSREIVVSREIQYVDRTVISPEIRYRDRIVIRSVDVIIISPEPVISPEIHYAAGTSSGGCDILSGSFIIIGVALIASRKPRQH